MAIKEDYYIKKKSKFIKDFENELEIATELLNLR
jgi:hypothetical protein